MAMLVQLFLIRKCVTVLHHPPHSPGLPPNYFAFPKLKLDLKGHRYEDIESVQQNVTAALKVIPQADFEQVMNGLEARLQ